MPNYHVEHDFDCDPTFVCDSHDDSDPLVTLAPSLPWQIRRELAQLVADRLTAASVAVTSPREN
jgi:hypothetical protein